MNQLRMIFFFCFVLPLPLKSNSDALFFSSKSSLFRPPCLTCGLTWPYRFPLGRMSWFRRWAVISWKCSPFGKLKPIFIRAPSEKKHASDVWSLYSFLIISMVSAVFCRKERERKPNRLGRSPKPHTHTIITEFTDAIGDRIGPSECSTLD